MNQNSNPLGNPTIRPVSPPKINPPQRDVVEKQDPGHTQATFLRDLDKVAKPRG